MGVYLGFNVMSALSVALASIRGNPFAIALEWSGRIFIAGSLVMLAPAATAAGSLLYCVNLPLSAKALNVLDGGAAIAASVRSSATAVAPILAADPYFVCWAPDGQHLPAGVLGVFAVFVSVAVAPAGLYLLVRNDPRLRSELSHSKGCAARALWFGSRRPTSIAPGLAAPTVLLDGVTNDFRPATWYTKFIDIYLTLVIAALQSTIIRPATISQVIIKAAFICTVTLGAAVHLLVMKPYRVDRAWQGYVRAALLVVAAGCAAMNAVASATDIGAVSRGSRGSTIVTAASAVLVVLACAAILLLVWGVGRSMISQAREDQYALEREARRVSTSGGMKDNPLRTATPRNSNSSSKGSYFINTSAAQGPARRASRSSVIASPYHPRRASRASSSSFFAIWGSDAGPARRSSRTSVISLEHWLAPGRIRRTNGVAVETTAITMEDNPMLRRAVARLSSDSHAEEGQRICLDLDDAGDASTLATAAVPPADSREEGRAGSDDDVGPRSQGLEQASHGERAGGQSPNHGHQMDEDESAAGAASVPAAADADAVDACQPGCAPLNDDASPKPPPLRPPAPDASVIPQQLQSYPGPPPSRRRPPRRLKPLTSSVPPPPAPANPHGSAPGVGGPPRGSQAGGGWGTALADLVRVALPPVHVARRPAAARLFANPMQAEARTGDVEGGEADAEFFTSALRRTRVGQGPGMTVI